MPFVSKNTVVLTLSQIVQEHLPKPNSSPFSFVLPSLCSACSYFINVYKQVNQIFLLRPSLSNFLFMLPMEFLSYSLEDRGCMFLDGVELSIDVLARNRNLMKNLDMKDICDFDKNMMVLDRETFVPNSFLGSAFSGISSDEMNDSLINKDPSTMVDLDHFARELGLGAEHYCTAYEPNNEKEPVVNLQLEKCADSKDVSSILSSEESMVSLLVGDSLPAKRARTTDLCPQIPICQVQGCYKDLSSSKDYHKRHRVCDIHSKTAKVIIKGIEQRFCQQCSRFHLLSEFDDGKRSCRKRLAGHNQRRRKPQFGTALGSRFFRLSLLKSASFLSPGTLAGGFLYQESKMSYNHNKQLKLEPLSIDISEEPAPEDGQSSQKSLANLHVIRNQHHPRTCSGATVDSASPCALSLLSAKSHKQGSHSTGFPMMTSPSTRQNQDVCIRMDQNSPIKLRKSTAESIGWNRHITPGMGNKVENLLVHDSRSAVCSVQKDGFLQTSDHDNFLRYISPEIESTVDLLQLSSHLQRVQQLRNSV